MAPKPLAPLPKATVGSSVIAEVITNKFLYHLPLYRQAKMFSHMGADFAENTLSNWVMQTGEAIMNLLSESMWQELRKTDYLQVDESPLKIQVENKKGYLWVYYAPYVEKGLIMFEFAATRSSSVVDKRLAGYTGLLQTDGYSGYNNIRKRKDIHPLGCLTHARRKFAEVVKITKNTQGVAAEFIESIKPLYALEESMRNLKLHHRVRKRMRIKEARPRLLQLKKWLKTQKKSVLPKSKLGIAISYALNNWSLIINYTRHGKAEIDTNYVENEIRPSAIGKRNLLFVNNAETGNINAFWFSLVQSALANNVNPKLYVNFLLDNLHKIRRKEPGFESINMLPHMVNKDLLTNLQQQKMKTTQKLFYHTD
jgi:hypothetical protein